MAPNVYLNLFSTPFILFFFLIFLTCFLLLLFIKVELVVVNRARYVRRAYAAYMRTCTYTYVRVVGQNSVLKKGKSPFRVRTPYVHSPQRG